MMGDWGNLCFLRRSIGRRLGAFPADANSNGVVRQSGKLWIDSRKSPKSIILVEEIDLKRRCCTMRAMSWLMSVSKRDIEIHVEASVFDGVQHPCRPHPPGPILGGVFYGKWIKTKESEIWYQISKKMIVKSVEHGNGPSL